MLIQPFPVAPGYESIGRVEQAGQAVTAVAVGDLIAIDAPHADGHLLTEQAVAAGRLPAALDSERAVFFTLARVALGGVHDAADPWATRWSSSGSAQSGCWPLGWPAAPAPE